MQEKTIQRRAMLTAAVISLAAAAGTARIARAVPDAGLSPRKLDAIRRYYAAWEQKDWHPVDLLLADDFTFTSANNDDHIDKSAFKERCWDSQIGFTKRFDLKHVIGNGNDAFVLYVGETTNGKTFRNVEYLRLNRDKVEAIECYFGSQGSFPSAVSSGQN